MAAAEATLVAADEGVVEGAAIGKCCRPGLGISVLDESVDDAGFMAGGGNGIRRCCCCC